MLTILNLLLNKSKDIVNNITIEEEIDKNNKKIKILEYTLNNNDKIINKAYNSEMKYNKEGITYIEGNKKIISSSSRIKKEYESLLHQYIKKELKNIREENIKLQIEKLVKMNI